MAVLAYEGLCTFEFGIAVELFGLPRPELDQWYSFEVCGLEKGPFRATGGVSVLPRRGLKGLLDANTIIIPGWRNPDEPPPQRLVRMLIAHPAKRIFLLCVSNTSDASKLLVDTFAQVKCGFMPIC